MFNGIQYEYIDVGNTTSWTTNGAKIWPTYNEIQNGRYTLHIDHSGDDLPNDPVNTYINAKGQYGSYHNYWFRVAAYNSYGDLTSIDNNWATPTLPDSTSPSSPSGIYISLANNPPLNTPNTWQVSVSWSPSIDFPSAIGSSINYYKVRLYRSGGILERELNVSANSTSVTFDNLSDSTTYYASVQAYDNNSNYSGAAYSSSIATQDRTRPSTPSSVTLDKTDWTNAALISVSWTGITDYVGVTSIQYSIDNSPWINMGTNSSSGTYTMYTYGLSEGTHSIAVRGIDAQGNEGYSNSVVYKKDTTIPQSVLSYPQNQQTISGVVNVKGSVSDSHFSQWILDYGAGDAPASYTTIASGTNAVSNAVIAGWNVSALSEGVYTLRLTAKDSAGNSTESKVKILRSNLVSYSPTLQIDSPISGSIITELSKNILYQRIGNGGAQGLKGKLYINNELVDEETVVGEGLSFNALNYPEGKENNMYIEAVDADGNKLYSTTMYASQDGTGNSLAQSTHMFTVKLVEEPKNLTATPNVNYTVLLRWDYDANKIASDKITFNVYRGTTEDFVPVQNNKIAEGLSTPYWYDYNLNYGQKFYYKVTAVKPFGQISRESVVSNSSSAVVVAKNEIDKRLGLENYWGFSEFSTGSGEGYINLSTGNLSYQTVDFAFPGSKFVQVIRRTYNSQSTTKTPLGYGSDFSFNTNLLKEYDEQGSETGIILKDGDGSIHRFPKNTDGTYSPSKGSEMTLSFISSEGTFKIKRKDNIEYQFDKTMRLKKFTEPNGNYLELSYNSRGNVNQISDNFGNTTVLEYDNKDRLVKATDPSGRSFNYIYDDLSDRLIKMYSIIENNVEYLEEYVYDSGFNNIQVIKDPKKNTTKLEYTAGKLTKVTNPINEYFTLDYGSFSTKVTSDRGKSVTFNYNDFGGITKKIDNLNHSINYEYDTNYNVSRMYYLNLVDGMEKELNYYYTYDSKDNLLTIKDPLGNVTDYSLYNDFNEVGQVKAPIEAGKIAITTYSYDDKGNLLTVVDPEGKTASNTYNTLGYLTSSTDRSGNTTGYDYDAKGRLVKITEPQGKITEVLAFDAQNNPTKIKDPLGNIIDSHYDSLGRQDNITYPDGKYIKNTYDLNGNLIEARNRRGFTTSFQYDEINRPKATTNADGKTSTTSYSYGTDNNMVVTAADPEGRISKTYYDSLGRVIKKESGGSFLTYEYDYIGNMTKVKDAEGRETDSTYNELNQGIKVISDPNGEKVVNEFTFDIIGNKLTSKDGEGNITTYSYDKIGRLKKVLNTVGGEEVSTGYEYDLKDGNLVYNKSIDAEGRETLTYFDSLGRKVKEVKEGTLGDSERQITQFEYDLKGNLKKLIKPDGNIINYEYNIMDRLKKVSYDSSNYTTFGYDDNGNRNSMIDVKDGTSIETSYSYDSLDRMKQYVQEGSTLNYEYDGSDNTTKVYYTEGNSTKDIEYKYDMLGRLQSILSNGKTVRDYSYTPAGKIDYINNYRKFDTAEADFVRVKYSYNSLGLTTNISYLDNNNVKKEEYSLIYDKRGYIKTEVSYTNYDTEKTVNKSYNYDEIGRLLNASDSGSSKTTSYTYDKVGNRLTMNDGTDSFSYDYNQFNSLLETKKNGTLDTSFSYDANGNEKTEIAGTKTTTFGYDTADRLTNLTITDGSSTKNITNYYNGDGQRIKQTEDGLITKYYYDGDNLLYTADQNNNKAAENILDSSGTIVASKRFDGSYNNMYFFYNYDIRGSVTNIIGPDGSLVKGYSYDEFGKTKETGDSQFKNDVKFTGAVHDLSPDLYYMNSRFYNPNTGRFLSQDTYSGNPYEPWTQHLYNYSANNPINYIDPTGHAMMAVDGGGIGYYSNRSSNDSRNNGYTAPAVQSSVTSSKSSSNSNSKNSGQKKITIPTNHGYSVTYTEEQWSNAGEIMSLQSGVIEIQALYNYLNGDSKDVQVLFGATIMGKFGLGAIAKGASEASNLSFKTGKAGEKYLAELVGGNPQVYFKTSKGGRFIDQLANGVAYESKVGYTTLTKFVKNQIMKDAELIKTSQINGAEWNFFKSGVTGKVGASKQLLEFLEQNSIKYTIHK